MTNFDNIYLGVEGGVTGPLNFKHFAPVNPVAGPKGWAVRPLKRYASWVQNVVRQFGPYPSRA